MSRRAWLTPDTPPPEEERGRCFSVPDDLALVGAVTGALIPLTNADNWEAYGTMTPQEAADIMSAAFESFVDSDCSNACPPPVLPVVETPIYRQNPTTGRWEYIGPDGWVEPTGDGAIPDPAAREEETEALQKCGAASNAANSLKELYSAILGVYDSEIEPLLNQIEIAAQIAVAYGTSFGPVSQSFLAYAGAAWETFTYLLDQITENDWNAAWMEELVCILNSNVTVTDGVAHFDLFNVNNDLVGFILPVIDDFVRVRWQTWFLIQCIGSQGLDIAGATTAVEGACVTCDTWCVSLSPGDFGFTQVSGYKGYIDSNGLIREEWDGSVWQQRMEITVDTTNCVITRVGMVWDRTGGGSATYAKVWAEPVTSGLYADASQNFGGTWLTADNPANHSNSNSTKVKTFSYCAENKNFQVNTVTVMGTGINPFGIGSNC